MMSARVSDHDNVHKESSPTSDQVFMNTKNTHLAWKQSDDLKHTETSPQNNQVIMNTKTHLEAI